MFCWSCGHENSDNHKFCGECGKSLYKPEKVVQDITTSKNFSRAEDKKVLAPEVKKPERTPDAPAASGKGTFLRPPDGTLLSPPVKAPSTPSEPVVTSREPERPQQTNPLVEEPRVIHENPANANLPPAPPTMIRDRIPNRITGPSFLGLSDEASGRNDDSSYLLDEDAEASSPWRGYLMLALLVIVSLLVIRNWGDIRSFAAEKFGASDSAKHPAGPERVTASNDASRMTPDAAPEEGKSATPAEKTKDQRDNSQPEQSAKLEKPQSDRDVAPSPSDAGAKPTSRNEDESSAETAPPKPSAASKEKSLPPAYDNSQLEEARKYLQGRGVPQDCNRGVSLLRSAAAQPNPKARIQMAALYVSGHCVAANTMQAYNWFAKAQELEPHNRMIERNLDSLWAKMTDEERRQVLR